MKLPKYNIQEVLNEQYPQYAPIQTDEYGHEVSYLPKSFKKTTKADQIKTEEKTIEYLERIKKEGSWIENRNNKHAIDDAIRTSKRLIKKLKENA